MSQSYEHISELIVISEDTDGVPHVAPFGIRRRAEKVHIAPYRPSKTLDNLLSNKKASLNMTDDVRVFAAALTNRECWQLDKKGDTWVLDSALSVEQLNLQRVEDDVLRPSLYFDVTNHFLLRAFMGFNRAQFAVIELAVLVSRLHLLPIAQIKSEITQLKKILDKTAGEREMQAWSWLIEKIDQHEKLI